MTTIQAPAGMAGAREVSEVTSQLKETLLTSTSSSSSSSSSKKGYQLEQDIGTMLYDGESLYKYNILSAATTQHNVRLVTPRPEIMFHSEEVQLKYTFYPTRWSSRYHLSPLSSLLSPLAINYIQDNILSSHYNFLSSFTTNKDFVNLLESMITVIYQ